VLVAALLFAVVMQARAQTSPAPATAPPAAAQAIPNAPDQALPGTIRGSITDTDHDAIPNAKLVLEDAVTRAALTTGATDGEGAFTFANLPPGKYRIKVTAQGFSAWKIENIDVQAAQENTLIPVELGVESIDTSVNAIFSEDLAEQEITAEEHQRILGILPNFYVSYLPNAQPLTKRQKFKLAFVVSRDPITFFTTGVNAGTEQLRRLWSGLLRLRAALCCRLWRPPERHLLRLGHLPFALPSGPALLLSRPRQGDRACAVCRIDGGDLQGRQRHVATKLLQRPGQPRFGRNLQPLLPEQRQA
jgi:hypothetical protein